MGGKRPVGWVIWLARIVGGILYVIAALWVLVTALVIFGGGGPVPLTGFSVESPHPFWAILFFLFVGPLVLLAVRGLVAIAFMPLALLFSRAETTAEKLQRSETVFLRHVGLQADGKGATFFLNRLRDGELKWSWDYDGGLRDDMMTMVATERALCVLEKELGMPMTFPHSDPDRPTSVAKEPTPEEAAAADRDRRERAASGDPLAIRQLWYAAGEPVTTPESLVVGEYYNLSYDIAQYAGRHEGRRFDGYAELADEPDNDHGIWYAFETAERPSESPANGTRYNRKELAGEAGDPPPVRSIPATREAIEWVFSELRESHREWERNRLPDRYF
jgi:hypothetical protein